MSTLLLRLEGPMQSWGTQSRHTYRETGLEPSKSGVIGLLCAALGKPRDESKPDPRHNPPLHELAALRMGVRIDRPGVTLKDYHTVGGTHLREEADNKSPKYYGALRSEEKPRDLAVVVSHRFYLADASFLVGLQSNNVELLQRLRDGLLRPVWQLCLGRKAFVPSVPVWAVNDASPESNISSLPLEAALADLTSYPLPELDHKSDTLRVVLEVSSANSTAHEIRKDHPLSFNEAERDHSVRYVKQMLLDVEGQQYLGGEQ